MSESWDIERTPDPQQRATLRQLRRLAFTLVTKLDYFEDVARQIYYTPGIPSTEGIKQEMWQFYSQGGK